MASTGLLGSLLFLLYLLQSLCLRTRSGYDVELLAWLQAARLCFVPILFCRAVSGTTPDIGVALALVLALALMAKVTLKNRTLYLDLHPRHSARTASERLLYGRSRARE